MILLPVCSACLRVVWRLCINTHFAATATQFKITRIPKNLIPEVNPALKVTRTHARTSCAAFRSPPPVSVLHLPEEMPPEGPALSFFTDWRFSPLVVETHQDLNYPLLENAKEWVAHGFSYQVLTTAAHTAPFQHPFETLRQDLAPLGQRDDKQRG